MSTAREAAIDPQAIANGYTSTAISASGAEYVSVSTPLRFDGEPPLPRPAPEHGAQTDEVLQSLLGLTDEELMELKISGAAL